MIVLFNFIGVLFSVVGIISAKSIIQNGAIGLGRFLLWLNSFSLGLNVALMVMNIIKLLS